jgi:hypothetical protein
LARTNSAGDNTFTSFAIYTNNYDCRRDLSI